MITINDQPEPAILKNIHFFEVLGINTFNLLSRHTALILRSFGINDIFNRVDIRFGTSFITFSIGGGLLCLVVLVTIAEKNNAERFPFRRSSN